MKDAQTEIAELKAMLQGAINQRNHHENECLQLLAQLMAKDTALQAAHAEIAELKKAAAEAAAAAPKANGLDEHAAPQV